MATISLSISQLHESAVLVGTRTESCHKNRTGDATTNVVAHHHQDNNSPDWRNIVRSQAEGDDAALKGFPPDAM